MAMGLVAVFASMGYFECDLAASAGPIFLVSLAATLVESLPINTGIDDNLSVPSVAALLGSVLLPALIF